MTPIALYTLLIQSYAAFAGDALCNSFDGHILACMFTAGVAEVNSGGSLAEALGVSGEALRGHIIHYFPGSLDLLESFGLDREMEVGDDEQCLRQLLLRSRSLSGPLGSLFSIIIARRATRPNHLWQDLGLTNRNDLSMLMQRHFASLARRNMQDMKWKKFFYRTICRDEGYRMCIAPSCSECSDFHACFGDESGESLLARTRFQMDTPGWIPIKEIHAR
ncbi:MAG: nitrogen fixation protein NifQ [Acidobacteriaceae bacterium]